MIGRTDPWIHALQYYPARVSGMGNNRFFSTRVSSFMRARTRVSSRSLSYQASSRSIHGPGRGVSSNSYIRSANRDRRDADCCLAQQMDLLIKNKSWQHHLYLKSILRFFRVGRTYRIIHVSVNSYIRSAYRAPRDADVVLFKKWTD